MSRYTAMSSKTWLFSILLLTVAACRQPVDESPLVASVYGHELRQSDLKGLVGEGVAHDDSVAIVANYVDQGRRQTVMLDKAEKNVKQDFSRQLDLYRKSLLTYTYEQQIVKQLLDTAVSDYQVEEYYSSHQDEFLLKNPIVKATYVMAPLKSPIDAKLKAIVARRNFQEADVVDLEELASRYHLQGYYDIDSWIPFYTLQTVVPITTYNESMYLKQNRSITLQDDSLRYYVRIVDYKISDEIAPLELQRENIKAIILNHRKTELLAKLQDDLMAEAERGGYITRK